MTMADKIMANAGEYLDPDEELQGAFAGQQRIRMRLGDGGYRVVVATQRRFLVFQSGSFSQTKIKSLIQESPREQRLGDPSGLWHEVTLGSESMLVNRRYFKQVRAIDEALEVDQETR